jgi:hypothetical protein
MVDAAMHLIPRTGLQWGYTAIGAAFILLAVGAVLSVYTAAPPPPPDVEEVPITPVPEPA